jgi:hypothetical protein
VSHPRPQAVSSNQFSISYQYQLPVNRFRLAIAPVTACRVSLSQSRGVSHRDRRAAPRHRRMEPKSNEPA